MNKYSRTGSDIRGFLSRILCLCAALAFAAGAAVFVCREYTLAASKDQNGAGGQDAGIRGGAFEVTRYSLNATVKKDHSYEVEERISVSIPDDLTRIDFAIPNGNFRISDLTAENLSFSLSSDSGEGDILTVNDPDKLKKGSHEYVIKYCIREYQDRDNKKDMFYFNVLPPDWERPIGSADISVSFPEDFPWGDMHCYAGQFGVEDSTNKISLVTDKSHNTVKITGSKIPENYAITLKAQLPEGYWQGALSGDWTLSAMALVMTSAVLIMLLMWLIGGRDPRIKKEKITRPIEEFSPVELGYVFNGRLNIRDVISLILMFARKGYLTISEYEPKRYRLIREEDPVHEEKMFRTAYDILFEDVYKGRSIDMDDLGPRLELIRRSISDDIASGFSTAADSSFRTISRVFRYISAALLGLALGTVNSLSYAYDYNEVNYAESLIIAAFSVFAVLLLCGKADARDSSSSSNGRSDVLLGTILLAMPLAYTTVNVLRHTGRILLALFVLMLAAVCSFLTVVMRSRGTENARLVTGIRRLRNFICHPEPKDILENHLEDSNYYYDMLLYALAFGAEEVWAISFLTLDVPEPDWYRDDTEGHAFINLRSKATTTIDYARDLRYFVRTLENIYGNMHGMRKDHQ